MRPRQLAAAAGTAVVLVGAGFAAVATGGTAGPDADTLRSSAGLMTARTLPPLPAVPAPPRVPDPAEPPNAGATAAQAAEGRWTAQVLRPALLRTRPDGRQVARISPETGYGARRVYAVAALRPGWVGVRALQRPNDRLGWVPTAAVRLEPIRTTLVADLSARELTVRVGGKVRWRFPIGIGRPGSKTPLGRYGVTDRLRAGGAARAIYGCCVLPLTGHQPNLPAGWKGGTRLALHGTPGPGSVGREVSAGCLRMRNADIQRLMTSVPLGTTLTVRA